MATEKTLANLNRAKRVRRARVGGRPDVLTVKTQEPGFEYRVVADRRGRIEQLTERGYEIVTHETEVGDKRVGVPTQEGSPVKINLGRGEQGYLMRIPKEWYEEDQAAKQEEIAEIEEQMIPNEPGHYGKVVIERNRG